MRIGINARLLFGGRMEGIQRYSYEILSRMISSHPEHQFYLFFDRKPIVRLFRQSNVYEIVLGPPTRHPILQYWWLEHRLPKYLSQKSIDVFVSTDGYSTLHYSSPKVLVTHDLAYLKYGEFNRWWDRKYYERYIPRFINDATVNVAVSKATARHMSEAFGINTESIKIIPNATPDGFEPVDTTIKTTIQNKYMSGSPYMVYLGALHPRKNVINMIHAFEKAKTANNLPHKLLIIGRLAWKSAQILQAIKRGEASSYLVWKDNVSDHEVKTILPGADALLYLSSFEGFGIPILEGMSAGVPVITSDCSSMPEVAGEAALLVNPNDVTEISNAICKVAKDKSLSKTLISSGLSRSKEFNWDDSAKLMWKAIKDAIPIKK